MFQLNDSEWLNLKSQIATSSWGGVRKLPYAFTEQGVAMLSSVLRSETAIQVNIQIIRVFTQMKQLLMDNKDLLLRIKKIEHALLQKNDEIKAVFAILKSSYRNLSQNIENRLASPTLTKSKSSFRIKRT